MEADAIKTAAHIRVSTAQQGKSGLGLEAQQALARFAEAEGYSLIETFQEIETGRERTRWTAGRNSLRHCRSPRSASRRSSLLSWIASAATCTSSAGS